MIQGATRGSVYKAMISRGGGGLLALVCAWFAVGCSNSAAGPGSSGGPGGATGTSTAGQAGGSSSSSSSGGGAAAGSSGSSGAPGQAGIQVRFSAPAESSSGLNHLLAFAGGGAVRPGLESLEYYIFSVQICESMEANGSGFSNPTGCLELYRGDRSAYNYDLEGDWTALAEAARGSNAGFVNLLDPASRAALGGTTPLQTDDVRSYNYGIITWSLPIKVKATIPLGDGTFLYTHDGATRVQTIGVDNYRDYFTAPDTALDVGPADKAVVILGNGGNWFKFQNPLSITQADLDQKRQWVLDLVFNPEGIVKGFSGDGSTRGNIREQSEAGISLRGINVPMLDLAPVPHRATEQVVRESYIASLNVNGSAFDARIELYSVAGDPNRSVYGVDVKTLVTPLGSNVPPEISKISSIVTETDGTLSFLSFKGTPVISGFHRVAEERGTTHASIVCATNADRAGVEGGAAIVMDVCPSASIDATFTLVGRRNLDGDIPLGIAPRDAGAPGDAGASDAGALDNSPDAGG